MAGSLGVCAAVVWLVIASGGLGLAQAYKPGTQQTLEALAKNLAAKAGRVSGTAELGPVPAFAVVEGAGWGQVTATPDRTSLSRIVTASLPAQVRGLALLWLASDQNPRDLALVDMLLDSNEAAGQLPSVSFGQAVLVSYPVRWKAFSLGELALVAAERIVGRHFSNVQAYRAWTAEQGQLTDSFVYWETFLRTSRGERAKKRLTGLMAKNPKLFARVLLARRGGADDLYGLEEDRVLEFLRRQIGPNGLLALLHGRQAWPEFAQPERFAVFAAWVLPRWKRLMGAKKNKELLSLWAKQKFEGAAWVRRDLALAAARAHPSKSLDLLKAVLAEEPTPRMGPVLAELARLHLKESRELIGTWFLREPDMATEDNRVDVLAALKNGGEVDAEALAAWVLDPRFRTDSPRVVAGLAKALEGLGLGALPACASPMAPRTLKNQAREMFERSEKAAAAARHKCLLAVKTRLSGLPRR